ncbi:Alpha/Beta hydrolase protein [Clohesyomyces aquaticus]|uniref:Alpha/Beta hydrolase protein n=1 Tax=Clohesyomyces aquaticus TaxID=1231657 RepID=A0A1Y1ZPY7_9PLEO|nr:Alpha/Beta hydrolase protein [Clohesyomyces aquaticus]
MPYPQPYILGPQPGNNHTHTVILFHGRSSTAKEFASDLISLQATERGQGLVSCFPTFRWVFPDAGQQWCTAFKDKRSAWFDTFSLNDLSKRQDLQVAGLRDALGLAKDIIKNEVDCLGGHSRRVVIGGFSQGAATALWSLFTGVAASTCGALGGFISLSGWMPFTAEATNAVALSGSSTGSPCSRINDLSTVFLDILGVEPLVSAEAIHEMVQAMPVFLGHGSDDELINVSNCHALSLIFHALQADVEVHVYEGAERDGHWIKEPEELGDVVRFIQKCFAMA